MYDSQPPAPFPPTGLCVRAEFVKARDGDTIEVRMQGSAYTFALRLIDCWCPETDSRDPAQKAIGLKGKEFTTEQCRKGWLTVFVPLKATDYPLKSLTFDRVPAWIYVGDERTTLNEQLVKAGLASTQKNKPLGE